MHVFCYLIFHANTHISSLQKHPTSPINNLAKWNLDNRVLAKLRGTGFDTLRNLGADVRLNLDLISALVSKYDNKRRCFAFRLDGESTVLFGLEDVLYVMGFPIDGKPITGKDESPGPICLKYLGLWLYATVYKLQKRAL